MRTVLLGMGWFPDETGGLNRYVRGLHEALLERGVPVRTVVVGPASDAPAEVTAVEDARAPLLRRLRSFAAAARAEGGDSEVVHAHFALYALLPILFGPLRGKPLVVSFHGPWAEEARSARRATRAGALVRRAVERSVYRRAGAVIVLSHAFGRVLVDQYGVSPWRVHRIAPGVDLDTYCPADRVEARLELHLPPDAFVAVTVRRLVPRMGIDVLVDAWADVVRARPGAVLLVAGDGSERAALERRVRALGIGEAVRFLGRARDDVLARCYTAADVSVVPTRALEGFGLVCLESLACGTPVVATAVGGLPEVLAPLDRSLLVAPGDVRALARRLVGDLPARDACRTYAAQFTWDRAAAAHVDVYADVAGVAREPRRRVVFVDHTAVLSGGELALARLLPALDVDAHVVLAEDGPLVSRLQEANVSVEVLPMSERARALPRGRAGRDPLAALAAAWYVLRLMRRLRALKPDLVHTNSLKAALYGGFAARLARIPVVWHVRDRIAPDYLPPGLVRPVRRAAARVPRAVIANSEATRDTLLENTCVTVVPSPVAQPRVHAPRGGGLRVGMVGRIAPWKGQHVFLNAFALAFPNGDERARILGAPLFGDDELEYAESLRARAAELGIANRVEFAGFSDDVERELAQLDILVHASVVPEPFGQVVAEGMAAGLAVVAAGAGGPAEMIDDGRNGLLYAAGDTGALAEALRRLGDDAELRQRLGDAARERASEYAPEHVARMIEQVYDEVLRGS